MYKYLLENNKMTGSSMDIPYNPVGIQKTEKSMVGDAL